MKNNKGISIISFILTILILILIVFLGYEIFYADILDIGLESDFSQGNVKDSNKVISGGLANQEKSNESYIAPIIDDDLRKRRKHS